MDASRLRSSDLFHAASCVLKSAEFYVAIVLDCRRAEPGWNDPTGAGLLAQDRAEISLRLFRAVCESWQ